MNGKHQSLIDSLSSDIENKQRTVLSANRVTALWLFIYIPLLASLMWWLAPFRDNVITQLLTTPRFALETVLGFLSVSLLAYCAIKSSVPGSLSRPIFWLTVSVTVSWIGHISFGLYVPALEPSMAGKRPQCYFEALYYSVPASIVLNALVLRRYTLTPFSSGLLAGASAGLVTALMMQVACMYDAYHGLTHHLIPAAAVALVSAVAVYLIAAISKRSASA